jgi:hypothetical protein
LVAATLVLPALAYADRDDDRDQGRDHDRDTHEQRGGDRDRDDHIPVVSEANNRVGVDLLRWCSAAFFVAAVFSRQGLNTAI